MELDLVETGRHLQSFRASDTAPARLAINPFSNAITPDEWNTYAREWEVPSFVDAITITQVSDITITTTGIEGQVFLITSNNQTAFFNLTTESWTLAGHPWQPAATATPQPVP
ncbi:MAG: hypothetical protein HC828_22020 [Blastochloris sp.]|nr:hypothetical protein [Blastochloris sp.]